MQKQRNTPGGETPKNDGKAKLDNLLLKEAAEKAKTAQDNAEAVLQQTKAPKLRAIDACCNTYWIDDGTGQVYRDPDGKRKL